MDISMSSRHLVQLLSVSGDECMIGFYDHKSVLSPPQSLHIVANEALQT